MNLYFKKKKEEVYIPGSKSISNRVLIFSFLCFKKIIIKNLLKSEDINVMLYNLKKFKNFNYYFFNKNINIFNKKSKTLKSNHFYFNNAGTVARPLFSIFFFINKLFLLDGNENMRKRPLKGLIKILNNSFSSKKKIIFLKNKYFFPVIFRKIKVNFKKSFLFVNENKSSQFLTSFIIGILLVIKKPFLIKIKNIVSINYVKLTIKIIKFFNIKIKYIKKNILIFPSNFFYDGVYKVEKDIISASYFFIKKFFNKKIHFKIFNQNEKNIIIFFKKIGYFFYNIKKFFKILKFKKKIYYLNVNCYSIIDSSMIIPILIFKNVKKIKIFNIYNWNFKECNRIIALSKEFKKIGSVVSYGKNWLIIKKNNFRKNIIINTYNDHRIAMVFYNIFNYINKPNCVKKTFPNFFK
ncbi:hypothetical protein [Candidatus Vidania fulgoroideorum]